MKALLKIAKIVCYVCSFPLFMVFAILASMHNVEKGGSYGLLTYASIIVAVLFSVIWAIVVLVQELKLSKKDVKNKAKKIRKQTACQVVVSLMLCSGLMFVLDGALPMIFGDLTSGTIFYEDVAESDAANNRATLNKDMLDAVIARSVTVSSAKTKTATHNTSLITNSPNTTTAATTRAHIPVAFSTKTETLLSFANTVST